MKKITAKFFIMITALMVFFAGCNNLLDNINDDKKDSSSKTVTLKGSFAVEGDAVPGEFLAMTTSGSARSAVSGGTMNGEYNFALNAISKDVGAEVVEADIEGDQFSITLDAEKNYTFDLTLNPTNASASAGSSPLTVSKIMFGDKESTNYVKLKGYSFKELENTKMCFSPDTSIPGNGKIALEIKTSVDKVKYMEYTLGFNAGTNYYEGTGSRSFVDGKTKIELTEFTTRDGMNTLPISNGVYDFTFEFFDKAPDPSAASRPTPLAITYQKVNVFAGFVTDTWISDGSAYFKTDAGKPGEFTVTQTAIDAYKNPKEFYVTVDDNSYSSWGNEGDGNSGTSIRRPFKTLQKAIDVIIGTATEPGINDGTNEYTIYVKNTIYPKEEVIGTNSNGYAIYAYKMADFTELGDKKLNLRIVGVGDTAVLNGQRQDGSNYGSIVVIGKYDEKTPANNIKIPNLNLTLENLAIRNGNEELYGGGIFNYGATLTLKNCNLSNNEASMGGAIFSIGSTVTLENCHISNNVASIGSGVYCMGDEIGGEIIEGEIVIDETPIISNTYTDVITQEVCYDRGIQLDNSTLTVKNTLTLGNSIRVGGESTITNGVGNDAIIKRDSSVNVDDFAFAYVDANATLNLKGNDNNRLVVEGFSEGIWLNDVTSFLKLDGEITGGSNKPLDVHVKNSIGLITGTANAYVPIILENTYSNNSKIFVKLEGINDISSDVLVSPCDENKAKTFDVVLKDESYTVTPAGKLKSAVFTQAEFISYCSELYESGNYADKMTLEIPTGESIEKVNLQYIEGMKAGEWATDIEINNVNNTYKYVTKLVIPDNYKTIKSSYAAQGLFYGNSNLCENLEEITLPSSIVSIGEYSFNKCTKLNKVTINGDVESIGSYAFANCHSLTEIELPKGLKSIGEHAFYRSGLTSIEIPDGVEELPEFAFDGTYSLARIKLPKNLKKLGQNALGGKYFDSGENVNEVNTVLTSIELPEGLNEIGESAFEYQKGLTSITIPESVTEIKNYVFSNCTALETIIMLKETPPTLGSSVFPDNVKAIYVPAGYASDGSGKTIVEKYKNAENWTAYKDKIKAILTKNDITDKSIEYYIVQSDVGKIDANAFDGCENLKGVIIPDSVDYIDDKAFAKCTNLESVTLKKYCVVGQGGIYEYTKLGSNVFGTRSSNSFSVYVPDGESVDNYKNQSDWVGYKSFIKTSTFNKDVLAELFTDTNVETIAIPFGYIAIDNIMITNDSAFANYSDLKTVTIPESVTSICNNAFFNCSELEYVHVLSKTPPTLGNDAFTNCDNLKSIYVPAGLSDVDDDNGNLLSCQQVYWNDTSWNDTSWHDYELNVLLSKAELATINSNYKNATTITIPADKYYSVIASDAFSECSDLETLTIPSSVQKIEAGAFANCRSLSNVTLGKNFGWRDGDIGPIIMRWDNVDNTGFLSEESSPKLLSSSDIATYLKDTYAAFEWKTFI